MIARWPLISLAIDQIRRDDIARYVLISLPLEQYSLWTQSLIYFFFQPVSFLLGRFVWWLFDWISASPPLIVQSQYWLNCLCLKKNTKLRRFEYTLRWEKIDIAIMAFFLSKGTKTYAFSLDRFFTIHSVRMISQSSSTQNLHPWREKLEKDIVSENAVGA